MDPSAMYRVTRSGRDVYVGAEEGLLQAARDGAILANDLIFDPTLDKWVFARSLSILTGFTLKGRRQAGGTTGEVIPTPQISEERLRGRNRRRRALARVGGMVLIIASSSLLIYLIPTKGSEESTSLSKFAEDSPQPSIRFEGTGSGTDAKGVDRTGPSNLDTKAVTVEATEGEPDRLGASGRKAEVEGVPGADQPSGELNGAVGESGSEGGAAAPEGAGSAEGTPPGSSQSGGSEADKPGPSAHAQGNSPQGVDVDPGQVPTGTNTGTPQPRKMTRSAARVYDRPKPSATLPTRLPVDPGEDVRPKVKIKAARAQDPQLRTKRLSSAMRTLERSKDPEAPPKGRDLLNARYEVELAQKSMRLESSEHPDLETTKTLIKELSKAFMDLCTSLHSDRFCTVKETNPHWPDVVVRSVTQEAALVGMTTEQLNASWGSAEVIKRERRGRRHCFSADCKRSALLMGDTVVEVNP
jgi:hypothetical protein